MIGKAVRWLILSTVALGLMGTDGLGAEPLPPRALARIGDHRFYHGLVTMCAVLSPDGRRAASAAFYPDSFSDKERQAYTFIVLWDAATGERLHGLRAPHSPISRLAFSPDGKRLVAAYAISDEKDGVVVFEVQTGKLLRQMEDFKNGVNHLQFSADGKQLWVSERQGAVSVWDLARGKQLRLRKPPPDVLSKKDNRRGDSIRGVLSPDGKVLAWGVGPFREEDVSPGSVDLRVQDTATDKLLYRKKFTLRYPRGLESFAFSPDGKRLEANGDKLLAWETKTGRELVALEVPDDTVGFLPTPDGRRALICDMYFRLSVWDLKTEKSSGNFYPGFIPFQSERLDTPQVFSADGKTLLLITYYGTLRLFDMRSGKERVVSGHRAPVRPRFSADGRTLFTSCGERRCSWDVSGKEPALLTQERRKSWEIGCLDHSADDRLLLDGSKDRGRLRETATGRVLRELQGADRPIFSGRFSPDATRVLLCSATDPSFRLYDVETGKELGEIKTGGDRLEDTGKADPVFSSNGRLVAWTDKANAIHLHDAATGKVVRTLRSSSPLPEAKNGHTDLLFSPDGEYLIAGRRTLPLRVFQVSSGREIGRFYADPEKNSETAPLACLAWSPDGRLLAVVEMRGAIVRLIEIASGKVRAEFAGHRHGVQGLAFSPNGQTLATGGEDNVVFLWNVTGAKTPTAVKKTPAEWWSDLASEDGKRAGNAIASLLRTPEASVAFLQERLRSAKVPDEKHLARLLADLDGDAFEKRKTASRELTQLGEQAEAALRRALKDRPSLEMRRRLDDLMDKLERGLLSPEMLRTLRAIEILEHIGTPAARQCLDELAKGAPDARQTQEAKRALDRLAKRGEQRKIDRRRMDP